MQLPGLAGRELGGKLLSHRQDRGLPVASVAKLRLD